MNLLPLTPAISIVKTGKYRKGDEDRGGADDLRPETFDSFAHFVDTMLGGDSSDTQ